MGVCCFEWEVRKEGGEEKTRGFWSVRCSTLPSAYQETTILSLPTFFHLPLRIKFSLLKKENRK